MDWQSTGIGRDAFETMRTSGFEYGPTPKWLRTRTGSSRLNRQFVLPFRSYFESGTQETGFAKDWA